ncbi:MAG: autotransporter outer membrane beta-barrel domain-containing protein [Pseudomonadota bacterium]
MAKRKGNGIWRCAVGAAFLTGPAGAEDLNDVFGTLIREQADGALAILGMSAVPGETTSTLFLDSGQPSDETYDFKQAQLGGGFRFSKGVPIYMEGFIGINRYDPVALLAEGDEQSRIPLKWTSFAATGGVGYEFDISEHWKIRPQLHLSLGRVQSDSSVGAQVIANRLGLDAEFLRGGGVTAGGYGGSIGIIYNQRWENDWEADLTVRYTDIYFEPIAGDQDLLANARAASTAMWSRLRAPTGYDLLNRPVRTVGEFSLAGFNGDQADVLGTDWLVQFGVGGEIDFSETWVPWITTTRLMFRYTRGEELEGFGVGLAASF